jgi:hypothetical protein
MIGPFAMSSQTMCNSQRAASRTRSPSAIRSSPRIGSLPERNARFCRGPRGDYAHAASRALPPTRSSGGTTLGTAAATRPCDHVSVDESVRRADGLARSLASRAAAEHLAFEYELQPYQHGCMVMVDLAGDDGLIFTVSPGDGGWIEVLDPHDHHFRLRAWRSTSCSALEASGRPRP